MKYKNVKEKYLALDLQLFADNAPSADGDGGEDKDPENEKDGDDDPDDDPDEKKFSQKDLDEAVEKRLARERRKWKRQQQKPDSGDKAGDAGDSGADSKDAKARKAAEDRAGGLEMKVACYEAGVAKDAVDDVAALAKSYMASDESLDLEDAIEKVVKKYPQFKGGGDSDDDTGAGKRKGWGERHRSPAKPGKTVDDELKEQLFGK